LTTTLVDSNVLLDYLNDEDEWFDCGTKWSPLPDFFIGAHAAISGLTLLTRDARRYRAYFPKLKILAP